MIGSTVDKYEVLQKVGEGGMATVYLGRHTTLDRTVAIKVLHPHLSSSTRNRKRFAREARAIEHLKHANILEIFDYSGIDSQECYIITEYVAGQTLTTLIESRGCLPSEIVSHIGIELCDALGFAHSEGVLHRDLKPDNVMVRTDGTVKLMDFGIARFLNESQVTLTGALVGSPAFMSPEQALEADLDARSDLFSLGTVLFYLVTGHLPFTGSNPSLILKKVIEGERPHVSELAPSISPTLADVIERLMATQPDGRFVTAEDARVALVGSLEEVGITVDDPMWSVEAFLEDPDSVEKRLHARVSDALLDAGKTYIEEGDALAALRLFNRLLSLDEDNEEVLELIQTLHSEPEPERRRSAVPWVALLGVAALLGLAAWVASSSPPPPSPAMGAQEEQPAEVEEPSPVPSETPLPLAAPAPEPPPPVRIRPTSPPLTRPAPEPVVLPSSGRGTLKIRSRIPADVFHAGKRIGSTRLPIELDAGSYVLQLRSDVILPREVRVEIGPGEVVRREVTIETRPARVRLSPSFADTCRVSLDGEDRGTVGALHREIAVPMPERVGHRLSIACPNEPVFEHVWSSVVLPGQVVRP